MLNFLSKYLYKNTKKDNHIRTKNKLSENDFQNKETQYQNQTNTIQELQELKDFLNKKNPIDDQIYFADSETTTPSSLKGKRKIKNSYTNKPIRLYNWNQPIRQIECYTLTVLQNRT